MITNVIKFNDDSFFFSELYGLIVRVEFLVKSFVAASLLFVSLVDPEGAYAVTQSYTTPGASTFTVPANVTSLSIVATGAGGGGGSEDNNGGSSVSNNGSRGGNGCVVTSSVNVNPNDTLLIFVGGGGGDGLPNPVNGDGSGGGGGGSTNISINSTVSIIAGGGGGGSQGVTVGIGGDGCYLNTPAGGNGGYGSPSSSLGGYGGSGGIGGSGGTGTYLQGQSGSNGSGGAGGIGGNGGSAGSGSGSGVGGAAASGTWAGGGGGGYGGGGSGAQGYIDDAAGGAGGSLGPSGSTFAIGSNAGQNATSGGNGSVSITYTASPVATTNGASAVTRTAATLHGTVNDGGGQTSVTFNYGLTGSYGSQVTAAQSPLAANAGNSAVSARISGLTCNTTYHYQVSATNSTATTNGSDRTFTTSSDCTRDPATLSVTNSPQLYTGSAIAAVVSCSSGGAVSNVLYNGSSTVPSAEGTYEITANCAANGGDLPLIGASAGNFLISYSAPASIPSLSEWTQLMLGLMVMMLIGWHFHRERSY